MQHYYSESQDSKLILKQIKVTSRNISMDILASSGVFSKKRVDKGTLLLISSMISKKGWKILDLGCGNGIIGLFAAKITGSKVYLTDTNERACMLAKKNAALNHVDAEVLQGSLYSPVENEKFDSILINPPQTAGKQICFDMISGAKQHLNHSGLLQLVARPNKGGKSLSMKMEETFGNVEVISRRSGYSVYVSKNL